MLPLLLLALPSFTTAQYAVDPYNPPYQYQGSTGQQYGYNQCGTGSSQTSNCQNVYINSVQDFCLWAPPNSYSSYGPSTIGNTEREVVSWCTKSGYGTRLIPSGAIGGAHFVQTPDYIQITGVGDLTKMNIPAGDDGGELDPHGADGLGNPIGSLVFSTAFGGGLKQVMEWNSFISSNAFCFRACLGDNAAGRCQHIYDVLGCNWNHPGDYSSNSFNDCKADNVEPPGVYGTSTFYQGQQPTPAAHPAAATSQCTQFATITGGGAAQPSATTTPPPTSNPSLQAIHPNGNTAWCLAAVGSSNGSPTQIQPCDGSASQQWLIGKGSGKIQLNGKDFYLDAGSNPSSGTSMKIWQGYSVPQQTWNYMSNNHISTSYNQCLDLDGGVLQAGHKVQVWECSDSNVNQVWTTGPVSSTPTPPAPSSTPSTPSTTPSTPSSSVKLHPNYNNAVCLTATGTIENGTPVVLNSCAAGAPSGGQAWAISRGNGKVKLAGTNFCLDAGTSPNDNFVKAKLWSCLDVPQQAWYYTDDNRIAITGGRTCLDDASGNQGANALVQTYQCLSGNNNQVWTSSS